MSGDHEGRIVLVMADSTEIAEAAMRVVEAAGLAECVTFVHPDHIGVPVAGPRAAVVDLLPADDFRDIVLKQPAVFTEPFIESFRPERDWKQRERQRPKRRRR